MTYFVVLTTPFILTPRLHAFHWLVHTTFYAIVMQLSSVSKIQSVRRCTLCRTVESRMHYSLHFGHCDN